MNINSNYKNLKNDFLFKSIADKKDKCDKNDLVDLSIGDVKLPLPECVVKACKQASDEMSHVSSFRGYPPNGGYLFLKEEIQKEYYVRGISLETNEIFISDGAKSDVSNILDLFSSDNISIIPDPTYPVYVDTNIMKGINIIYADANEENEFLPSPNFNVKADIIYICSPNNPTGACYNEDQLQKWIEYANYYNAIILYDAAYEAFILNREYCKSIYEIDGSKKCAIEFKSFSKYAGFTGLRCGYTIVPENLVRDGMNLHKMWTRRHSTKFNGVSYITQRAAQASLSDEGKRSCEASLMYYRENAKIISQFLNKLSIKSFGGDNSPYIWMKCPFGMKSWEFFDYLLEKFKIVGTPGSGFGKNGEYFFRLSCFALREDVVEAIDRLQK